MPMNADKRGEEFAQKFRARLRLSTFHQTCRFGDEAMKRF
jgi:hypothetical protein